MSNQPTVFISYSRKDEAEKNRLLEHLRVLQVGAGLIRVWDDDQIPPGEDWRAEIDQAMAQAKVAVLLITASFLSSELIRDQEISKLLEYHQAKGLKILPVIAKPCSWRTVEWLSRLQPRPNHGQPVWREGGLYADQDLANIADEIVQVIKPLPFIEPDPLPPPPEPPEIKIPHPLLEELVRDNIVLFCGEGISTGEGGLPTHQELAQALARDAGLGDIEGKSLPDIAQAYETKLGYQRLIAKILELMRHNRLYHPLPTHQLIASLPFKRIITTNWDGLLERAFERVDKPFSLVVNEEDVPLVESQVPWVIKLRGSLGNRASLVITGDDYYDIFAQPTAKTNLVQSLFASNTILFLGFNLTGQDFKHMYREVTRRLGRFQKMAYAVQRQPDPLEIQYWEKHNIRFIEADTLDFLQSLPAQLQA